MASQLSNIFYLLSRKKQVLFFIFFLNSFFVSSQTLLNESFTTSSLSAGWSNVSIQGTQGWTIRNNPVFSSESNGYYAVFDDYILGAGIYPNEAALISPVINCSGRLSVKLRFSTYWAAVEGSHGYVEVSSNGGTTWNIIKDYTGITMGSLVAPVSETLDISAFISAQVKIRFRYFDGNVNSKYWYIDDIKIFTEPDVGIIKLIAPQYISCVSPVSYTNTESITVRIFNYGFSPVSSIPVTCEVSGGITQILTGTYLGTINGSDYADFTFSGSINLSADAVYHFKVYTQLSTDQYVVNDTLIDSRQQRVSSFPYSDNFNENSSAWKSGNNNPTGTDRWFTHGALPYLNGPEGLGKSWFINTSSVNSVTDEIWVQSPVFDLSNITNPTLSFDIKYQLHDQDYVWVQYSTDGGIVWSTLGTNSDPSWYNGTGAGNNYWRNNPTTPVNSWTHVSQKLCALSGQPCVQFRIIARPLYNTIIPAPSYYFAFDNFSISATQPDDIEPVAFLLPKAGSCSPIFSANETVKIVLQNNTCRPLANIPVTLLQSGAGVANINAVVPGPVLPFERYVYTFPGTINLTNAGTHNLVVTTNLSTDTTVANDSYFENRFSARINSFPSVYDFNSSNSGWASGTNAAGSQNHRVFLTDTVSYLGGDAGEGKSWFIDVSPTNNQSTQIWVESPVFDFSSVSSAVFSMDIKYQLHNNDNVWVEYSTNGGTTWLTLGTNTSPNWYNATGAGNNYWRNNLLSPVNTWRHVQHHLCELAYKPCVKFRIKAIPYYNNIDINGGYYYFAFDNVAITEVPIDAGIVSYLSPVTQGCLYSNTNTITVALYNPGCSPLTNIPVQCSISGALNTVLFDTLTGDTIPPNSSITFLFSNTIDMTTPGTYHFLTEIFLPGDLNASNDTLSTAIQVDQITVSSYPYSSNFNVNSEFWITGSSDNSVNHRWFERGTTPYLGGAGTNGDSWFLNADTVNNQSEEIWVESPVFDFTSVSEAILSMDIKYQLDNNDYVWVQLSTNGGISWSTLGSNTDASWYNGTGSLHSWINNNATPVTNWTTVQHFLCGLSGQPCVKFRVRARPFSNQAGNYYFAFDNFRITEFTSGNFDVGVSSFLTPVFSNCLYSPSGNTVKINIKNYGCSSVSNISVTCNISGASNTSLVGTFSGTISSGNTASYTFPGLIIISDTGMYYFNAYTNLSGDIDQYNDTAQYAIYVDQIKINSLPYIADFNIDKNYWKIGGTNTTLDNRRFEWDTLPYLNGSQSNGNSFFINVSGINNITDEIWVESPVFDFSNYINPALSMDVKYQLHNSDYVWVQYTTDGGTIWNTLGSNADPDWYNASGSGLVYWGNNTGNPVNIWTNMKQKLCFLAGQNCVKFRVRARPFYNTSGFYYFAFDNFQITESGSDDDIAPVAFFLPASENCSPLFSNSEAIGIVIQNNSCRTIYNIPLELTLSGAGSGLINTIIPGPVNPDIHYYFQLPATFDLSTNGNYILTATTNLLTDVVSSNNSFSETRKNNLITNYPYVEDFNPGNSGWSCNSSNHNNPVNRIFLHDTLSYLNGPEGNGKSWYIDVSDVNSVSDDIWVESPVFDFTSVSSPRLMMDIKYQLHNSNYVYVEYSTNGGASWSTLGNNTDPEWYNGIGLNNNYWRNNLSNPVLIWTTVQHSLCHLAGYSCVKFRIIARPYYNQQGLYYFAFDNFKIVEGQDIGAISVVSPVISGCLYSSSEIISINIFNWGCSQEVNIPVVCDISGIINTTLNGIVSDTVYPGILTSYSFSVPVDMTAVGSYNITAYTQFSGDINQANDTTANQYFVDQIRISSFPYLQDFNTNTGYWQAGSSDTTLNHRWFEYGLVPYLNGTEGQGKSWFINTDAVASQNIDIWVESPVFNFSEVVNPYLKFDIKYQLHNFNYVWVQYSTNGGTSWNTLGSYSDPNWYNSPTNYWRNNSGNPVNHWTTLEHDLCFLAGETCVKFRVRSRPFNNQSGNYYFAFDNFSILTNNLDLQMLEVLGCYGTSSPVAVHVKNNSTTYTCGNGLAFASSYYNTANIAKYAFDGNYTTSGWGCNTSYPCWLEYDFAGNSTAVNSYKILCSSSQSGGWNNEAFNPKSWKFQAYNVASWITLDSVTDGLLQMDVIKTFTFSNSVFYDRYRIYITASEGASRTHITELILSPMPETVPVIHNFTLNYSLNGNTGSYNVNGLNLIGGDDTLLLIPGITVPDTNSMLTVWCSMPNGIPDLRTLNDTIKPLISSWPNCNIHCINAIELTNSVTITSSTYNLPDNPIYEGSAEDYNFNLCADPDTFTVDQSAWYYFRSNCQGGVVSVTFQSIDQGPLGIQVSILQIPDDTCVCNPLYYNNIFCSVSNGSDSIIQFSDTLPTNTLYYIMVDAVGNTESNYMIVLSGNVDTLGSTVGSDTSICRLDTTVLHANLTGTYQWWISGDPLNIISTNQSVIVSPLIETMYCVKVTTANGCVETDSLRVNVNPSYFADITPVPQLCSDYLSVQLQAPDTGGIWNGTGITNAVSGIFEPTFSGAGTHQVIYTIAGICGDADTINISVLQRPYPAITPVDSICLDDATFNFIVSEPGGVWSGSGITDSLNGLFLPVLANTGTHQIIYQIAGLCGNSDTLNVAVHPIHDATITHPGLICQDVPAFTLTAAESGGIWSGTGITDSVNGIFNPATASVGTHQIIYTIAEICSDADTINISVLQRPYPVITPVDSVCLDDVAFNFIVSEPGGAWSGSGITDSLNGLFLPVLANTGMHQIIYQIAGLCENSDTINVAVHPIHDATIFNPGPICQDVPAFTLTAAESGGIWSGTGITDSVNGIFNPATAGVGIHQIIYTISDVCSASDTINITVLYQNHADIFLAGPFCQNYSPVNLTATNPGGIWSGTGITDSLQGTFNPALAGLGLHQIIYSISGQCGDTDTAIVLVKPVLTAQIAAPGIYCSNALPVILSASDPGGSWFGNGITDTLNGVFSPVIAGPGIHQIIYTIYDLCGDADTVQITVLQKMDATLTSENPLCLNSPVQQFNAADPGGIWSGTGITDTVNGLFNCAVAGLGTHQVIYTIAGQCGDADTMLVTVNPLPVVTTSEDTSVCKGSSITIFASGGISYHWSNGSNNAVITVTPASTTNYFVTVSDANCSVKDTVRITVLNLPNATATASYPACIGSTVTLNASGGIAYQWTGPAGFISGISNPVISNADTINSGQYTVFVTGANGCEKTGTVSVIIGRNYYKDQSAEICMGSHYLLPGGNSVTDPGIYLDSINSLLGCDSIIRTTLTVLPAPVIALTQSADSVYQGESVTYTANGASAYIWNTGENSSTIIYTSTSAGIADICVTGFNEFNCTDTACTQLLVKELDCNGDHLYIPNAFSPNGDGSNNALCLYATSCIETLDFRIYNRWGELVFESHKPEICWDGSFKGKPLNTAVFVYYFIAKLKDETQIKLQGNISLIK